MMLRWRILHLVTKNFIFSSSFSNDSKRMILWGTPKIFLICPYVERSVILSDVMTCLSFLRKLYRVTHKSLKDYPLLQVNNYEIVVKIFHISQNLTWYSEIVQRFTRISKFCSNYELTKQFMEICVNKIKKIINP